MKDYFVYLPARKPDSIWGCMATSVGRADIPPNTPYPPMLHPVDHWFKWSEGRVLQRYQIILISQGAGTFECESIPGSQNVERGSVLLLFPGVWHRYRPVAETGWIEHWIECHGPVFDRAVRAGLIEPKRSVLKVAPTHDLFECFNRCHFLAQSGALANQDLLSTMGLHILCLLGHLGESERGATGSINELVEKAHALIAQGCQRPLNLRALAAQLGVSYSHLRHSFTARVGISPREHYLNTRLQKAQDLLMNTTKSIKEIAEILGFESAYHLSKQFKTRLGASPKHWRAKVVKEPRPVIPAITP